MNDVPISWEQHLSPSCLSSENLEVLTEKVGTLGFRTARKNRCGAAKKRVRKVKVAEGLVGDSVGAQKQALQELGISETQGKEKAKVKPETGQGEPASSGGKGPSQVLSKRQRWSGGAPEGGQAKRPKNNGPLSYAKAAQEDIPMAIVCDGYPEVLVFRENFTNIQRAVGGLVDWLPEEGFTPGSSICTGQKRRPLWYARRRNQGLAGKQYTNNESMGEL